MVDILGKPNLIPLLRFDLLDARGISDLVNSNLLLGLGGLVGSGAGCMSAFECIYTDDVAGDAQVSIGPFQVYYSFPAVNELGQPVLGETPNLFGDGLNKGVRGATLQHDPREEGQGPLSLLPIQSLENLAVAAADAGGNIDFAANENVYPYLWCRPVLVEVASDVRRIYNPNTAAEEATTYNTRLRTRFEFALQLTRPTVPTDANGVPQEAPWIAVGRVVRWDTETSTPNVPKFPRIFPISVWDSQDIFDFTRQPGTSSFNGPALDGVQSPDGVAPTTLTQARSGRFGLPPIEGPNIGVSPFLSPYPPFDSTVFRRVGASIYNSGAGQNASVGLVEVLGLMRAVIQSHYANRTGSNRAPWYQAPARGLQDLSDFAEDLRSQIESNDVDIANLQESTAGLNLQSSRVLSQARVFYEEPGGIPGYQSVVNVSDNLHSLVRVSQGVVTIRIEGLRGANPANIEGVIIQPYAPSAEGGLTTSDWPGFSNGGGFDPDTDMLQHVVSFPQNVTISEEDLVEFTVRFRGTGGGGGTLVPVDCSFLFFLFGNYP